MSELDRNLAVNICENVTIQDFSLGKWVLGKRSGEQRRAWWTWRLRCEGTRTLSAWDWRSPHVSQLQQLQAAPPPMGCPRCPSYLREVVKGFVQVRVHPSWGLIGDFDRVLQDALGNDVAVRGGCWLRTNEDTEILVAVLTVLLQFLLQRTQPLGHQVDVLAGTKGTQLHQSPLLTPTLIGHQIHHTNEWHPPSLSTGSWYLPQELHLCVIHRPKYPGTLLLNLQWSV